MKFPWVSRERLEDAEKRLTAADAERLRLLNMLLGDPADRNRIEHVRAAERAADRVIALHPDLDVEPKPAPAEQGEPRSYSNPFDSLEKKFDRTFAHGVVPPQFKARMH